MQQVNSFFNQQSASCCMNKHNKNFMCTDRFVEKITQSTKQLANQRSTKSNKVKRRLSQKESAEQHLELSSKKETSQQLSQQSSSSSTARYKALKKIGQGSFGKAYLVERNSQKFILKKINLSNQGVSTKQAIFQEVKLMQNLSHLYVIKYVESYIEGKCVCIVMQYAEKGDLDKFIVDKKLQKERISQELIIKWFIQLCLGLKYIHDRKVLHRDLKADNIFLTTDNQIKIGDFGVSKVMKETFDLAGTKIGTPHIMAPEIFDDMKYNQKSDVWSLGCILYKLQTFRYPFESQNIMAMMNKLQNKKVEPIQSVILSEQHGFSPVEYSDELKNLTYRLLSFNPNDRPSVHTVLQIPFVKQHISNILDSSVQIYQAKTKKQRALMGKQNSFNSASGFQFQTVGMLNSGKLTPTIQTMTQENHQHLLKLKPSKSRDYGNSGNDEIGGKPLNGKKSSQQQLSTALTPKCLSKNQQQSQPCSQQQSQPYMHMSHTPPKCNNKQHDSGFFQNLTPSRQSQSLKMVQFKMNYPLLMEQNKLLKADKEALMEQKSEVSEQLIRVLDRCENDKTCTKEQALLQLRSLVLNYQY